MKNIFKRIGKIIGAGGRAFVALVGVAGITAAVANYAMTQGSGTNFGSVVVGGIHYAQQFICDLTTPSRCATVTSAGSVQVDTVASGGNLIDAIKGPVPSQSPKVPIGGFSICDEANGTTNPCTTAATVKPTSTPAAATDKAVVTDQRPGTNVTIIGPTADGSAASTPPVLVAGTVDGTATGAVAIPKVTSGGIVSTDTAQVNGVTTLTGTGAVGTGAQRVAVGTDTATIAGSAPGTAGTASANVITTQTPSVDPCETVVQTSTPISMTTATTLRIVAPVSAKRTYVCYLFLTSAAADNVAIVEGTGGSCVTGITGVVGGSTAANGLNFAANGGAAFSAGGKTAAFATAGTNVDLCLITSAATPLAGVVKWVQAP